MQDPISDFVDKLDTRYQRRRQVAFDAIIDEVVRSDEHQITRVTATINGAPGTPILVSPNDTGIAVGQVFAAENLGSEASPMWSVRGGAIGGNVALPRVVEFGETPDYGGYNGGDLLLGSDAPGNANFFYDESSGSFTGRVGTTERLGLLAAEGAFFAGSSAGRNFWADANTVALRDGSNVRLSLDSTVGLRIYDGSGTERVRLNLDGTGWFVGSDKLSWNSSGNLTLAGAITANTGYIGGPTGWVIGTGKLTSTGIGLATVAGNATYAFWAGHDTPSLAEFSVTHAGALKATSGTVGGWTIGQYELYAGSGSLRVGMKPGEYPFYAGSETPASAPFSVDSAGILKAAGAIISGTITANTGSIGGLTGWTIATGKLTSTGIGLATAAGDPIYAFWAGSDTSSLAAFSVRHDGHIKATAGYIGGWELNVNQLTTGVNATYVGIGNGDYAFWAGGDPESDAKFSVTSTGVLRAEQANISGTITAIAGSISGSLYIGEIEPRIHIDGINRYIESTNFASGTSGFRIRGEYGDAEFNNVTVRGAIKTAVFEKSLVTAFAGSQIIAKSAAVTYSEFSI